MKKDRSNEKTAVLNGQCCASGIEGLDDILAGGLPRDCFYLIQGDPGPWSECSVRDVLMRRKRA